MENVACHTYTDNFCLNKKPLFAYSGTYLEINSGDAKINIRSTSPTAHKVYDKVQQVTALRKLKKVKKRVENSIEFKIVCYVVTPAVSTQRPQRYKQLYLRKEPTQLVCRLID